MDISKNRSDGTPSPATGAQIPNAPTGYTRLLRVRQVMEVTGLSRMTIYRLEQAGNFPRRKRLSANTVAWSETDISQWVDSRPLVPLNAAAALKYSGAR
jgi:prophage regulatory protein